MSKLQEIEFERTAKIINWEFQIESGKKMSNEFKVNDLIRKSGTINTAFLENRLGLHYSTLTSALSRLEDLGLIKKVAVVKALGKTVSQWQAIRTAEEQGKHARKRHLEKYRAWVKRGYDFMDFNKNDLV